MDTGGSFLNSCVLQSEIYPVFLFVFGLLFEMDPLMLAFNYCNPLRVTDHVVVKSVLRCARLVQIIQILMMFHVMCRTICAATVLLYAALGCFELFYDNVSDISNTRKATQILLTHKSLEMFSFYFT